MGAVESHQEDLPRPSAFAYGEDGIPDQEHSTEGLVPGEEDLALIRALKDKLWFCHSVVKGSDVFDRGGGAIVRFRKDASLVAIFREEEMIEEFGIDAEAWVPKFSGAPLALTEVVAIITRESAERLAFQVSGVAANGKKVRYNFDPNRHDFLTTVDLFHPEMERDESAGEAEAHRPKIKARPSIVADPQTNRPTLILDVS